MYKLKILIITTFAALAFAIPAFAQTSQCSQACAATKDQNFALQAQVMPQRLGFWKQWNYWNSWNFWYQPNRVIAWGFPRTQRFNTQQLCATTLNPKLTTPTSPSGQKMLAPTTTKAGLSPCTSSDCDCKDFKTRAEAQRVLDAFPDDPFKLDKDKDGIACESLP